MWPAFPTSDYYGGSDASHVSLPDCWEHLFQGSLPRSRCWTLQRSLGGGYLRDPTAFRGSRPIHSFVQVGCGSLASVNTEITEVSCDEGLPLFHNLDAASRLTTP
jgi:hypothetical protein